MAAGIVVIYLLILALSILPILAFYELANVYLGQHRKKILRIGFAILPFFGGLTLLICWWGFIRPLYSNGLAEFYELLIFTLLIPVFQISVYLLIRPNRAHGKPEISAMARSSAQMKRAQNVSQFSLQSELKNLRSVALTLVSRLRSLGVVPLILFLTVLSCLEFFSALYLVGPYLSDLYIIMVLAGLLFLFVPLLLWRFSAKGILSFLILILIYAVGASMSSLRCSLMEAGNPDPRFICATYSCKQNEASFRFHNYYHEGCGPLTRALLTNMCPTYNFRSEDKG